MRCILLHFSVFAAEFCFSHATAVAGGQGTYLPVCSVSFFLLLWDIHEISRLLLDRRQPQVLAEFPYEGRCYPDVGSEERQDDEEFLEFIRYLERVISPHSMEYAF